MFGSFLRKGVLSTKTSTHTQSGTKSIVVSVRVRGFEIDTFQVTLQANDVLLLCTDGLWEMVRDAEIEHIIQDNALHASQMSAKLIEVALHNGGADNGQCYRGLYRPQKNEQRITKHLDTKSCIQVLCYSLFILLW